MILCDLDTSVPDWVIEHPETLDVFQELGIDYCCGGKSLAFACRERGLNTAEILTRLLRRLDDKEHSTTEDRAMAVPHTNPGDVIDVHPLGSSLATSRTATLFKSGAIEVLRLVLAAGKEISEHQAPGEITVQCLEGKIAFTALGKTQELSAGQLLYLGAGEPHSVRCVEAASVLVTILLRP